MLNKSCIRCRWFRCLYHFPCPKREEPQSCALGGKKFEPDLCKVVGWSEYPNGKHLVPTCAGGPWLCGRLGQLFSLKQQQTTIYPPSPHFRFVYAPPPGTPESSFCFTFGIDGIALLVNHWRSVNSRQDFGQPSAGFSSLVIRAS